MEISGIFSEASSLQANGRCQKLEYHALINHLHLRNFRAFKNQKFEFSKINVFVGPNNSGKSSALSAINLLAQTIIGADYSNGPLMLNGQFEQLGTFIDTVHGNRSNTPIEFSLGYADRFEVNLEFKYRQQRREIELSKFELSKSEKFIYKYFAKKEGFGTQIADYTDENLKGILEAANSRRTVDLLSFWPIDFRLRDYRFGIHKQGSRESADKKGTPTLENVSRELEMGWSQLRQTFRRFDSLGPFRDQPQRTYLYTGESASHVGKTGSNCITLLINDVSRRGSQRAGFIEEVSRWLDVTGIAKGLEIKSLTPRHFEVCVRGLDDSIHNICDVGFGCSQVLPVIVGGLNLFGRMGSSPRIPRMSPIFIIQEPEIHLHPNAQASLGSFFAGLSNESGQIFIETHSDNLVLRLARHVAQGDLKPGDVTVFLVKDSDGKKLVKAIRPNAKGVFEPEWPGGFFPQRQNESLALARASYSKKSASSPQLEFKYPEETK